MNGNETCDKLYLKSATVFNQLEKRKLHNYKESNIMQNLTLKQYHYKFFDLISYCYLREALNNHT